MRDREAGWILLEHVRSVCLCRRPFHPHTLRCALAQADGQELAYFCFWISHAILLDASHTGYHQRELNHRQNMLWECKNMTIYLSLKEEIFTCLLQPSKRKYCFFQMQLEVLKISSINPISTKCRVLLQQDIQRIMPAMMGKEGGTMPFPHFQGPTTIIIRDGTHNTLQGHPWLSISQFLTLHETYFMNQHKHFNQTELVIQPEGPYPNDRRINKTEFSHRSW